MFKRGMEEKSKKEKKKKSTKWDYFLAGISIGLILCYWGENLLALLFQTGCRP